MKREKGRGMFRMYALSAFDDRKTAWRLYADYLRGLSCEFDGATVEWKNIMRRVRWINENRL